MGKYKSLDPAVYEDKEVFVWGASGGGKIVKKFFEQQGLTIKAFVDGNPDKWGSMLGNYEVISPEQLKKQILSNKKSIVQIASCYEMEIIDELKERDIRDYVSYSEFCLMKKKRAYQLLWDDPEFYDYYLKHVWMQTNETKQLFFDYFEKWSNQQKIDSTVICCMPPKTGNFTVFETLRQYCGPSVLCVDTWHTGFYIPEFIRKVGTGKNKLITAVREPVSQNISLLFQIADERLVDLPEFWKNDYSELLHLVYEMDRDLEMRECIYTKGFRDERKTMLIQNFFQKQMKEVLGIDLLAEPFDTEKGYSVVTVNGLEIFIYQLEKFDSIKKELLAFAGVDANVAFEKKNDAERKYYYPVYQQVRKDICFSKEYFEETFNNPYITHFYSKEDIEKFKTKWKGHIIQEG